MNKHLHCISPFVNIVLIVTAVGLFPCSTRAAGSPYLQIMELLPPRVTSADGPYIVSGNVYVMPGSIVTIEPGTILLFENFAELHVQGTLRADGTPGKPVVFSSINDTRYNTAATVKAAPYDWNGITLYETSSGSRLKHSVIAFSVFGLKSLTPHVAVDSSIFSFNGKSDVWIDGKEIGTGTGPFSYGIPARSSAAAISTTADVTTVKPAHPKHGAAVNESAARRSPARLTLQISGISMMTLGAAAAIYFGTSLMKSQQYYSDISAPTEYNRITYTNADWNGAKQRRDKDRLFTAASAGVAVLGAVGFGISFIF